VSFQKSFIELHAETQGSQTHLSSWRETEILSTRCSDVDVLWCIWHWRQLSFMWPDITCRSVNSNVYL